MDIAANNGKKQHMTDPVEFSSGKDICRGWLFTPKGKNANGAGIVIAHGLAGTADAGLLEYGEGFAAAGFHALVFDYRGFGRSEGEPRQHVSLPDQRQDWRAAIAFLRQHDAVDADLIGLFGLSFSGGHVLYLGHEDSRICAVVAQVPTVDAHMSAQLGFYQRGAASNQALMQLIKRDLKASFLGGEHSWVAVAPEGDNEPTVLAAKEAEIYPKLAGETWQNKMTVRSFITGKLERNNAIELSDTLRTPVLVQMGVEDEVVSNEAIVTFARRCGPLVTLTRYPGGHFSMLHAPLQQQAITEAANYLTKQILG